jgi:hypothetical protein
MPVQPTPLPNELYQNEQTAKNDIDHALGLYEMMMGNSQAAPQTYKATISIDEFGQRKMKSKLADIEAALTRVGQVAIPLMQQLYTSEKVFRVIQPNNSMSKYVVNKKLIDDKTGEIKIFNKIAIGKKDLLTDKKFLRKLRYLIWKELWKELMLLPNFKIKFSKLEKKLKNLRVICNLEIERQLTLENGLKLRSLKTTLTKLVIKLRRQGLFMKNDLMTVYPL